jgi:hypothetical protein
LSDKAGRTGSKFGWDSFKFVIFAEIEIAAVSILQVAAVALGRTLVAWDRTLASLAVKSCKFRCDAVMFVIFVVVEIGAISISQGATDGQGAERRTAISESGLKVGRRRSGWLAESGGCVAVEAVSRANAIRANSIRRSGAGGLRISVTRSLSDFCQSHCKSKSAMRISQARVAS